MKVKRRELEAAAKELNEVLDLEPKIDVSSSNVALEKEVKEAVELVEPDDEFSITTTKIIKEYLGESDEEAVVEKGKKEGGDKKENKAIKTKWQTVIEIIVNKPGISLDELVVAMADSHAGKMERRVCSAYLREVNYTLEIAKNKGGE